MTTACPWGPQQLRLKAEETAQTLTDTIKDVKNEIDLLTADLTSTEGLSVYTKQHYENNRDQQESAEQKKTEHQTTIQSLTDQMEQKKDKIKELNRLAIELDITSTAIDSDTQNILETISKKLDTETRLLLDIETFIDYTKIEKEKSFETYMTAQVRVLEQTAELSKKQKELDDHKELLQTQLGIIKQQTQRELQDMFQSHIHKLNGYLQKEMTYEEGKEISDRIDSFISSLIPVSLY